MSKQLVQSGTGLDEGFYESCNRRQDGTDCQQQSDITAQEMGAGTFTQLWIKQIACELQLNATTPTYDGPRIGQVLVHTTRVREGEIDQNGF